MVRIASTSGRIDVLAEDRPDVDVWGDAHITRVGTRTTVSGGTSRLRLRVPIGSDLVIGTTSGRVKVAGRVGSLSVTTESGTVSAEQVRSADVRSATGRIGIVSSDDECRVRSTSGSVSIGSCGGADVATRSGKITLENADGGVHAHCTSGRIDITMTSANDIEAETVTGRIGITLPSGVRAFRTESADHPAPNDADCTVLARSVTGRVDVTNR